MQPPQLDNSATWRQRLATPWIIRAQLAASNPAQGLVTHLGERAQLYAWDVPTGTLRQLTDDPIGIMTGVLAPDGRWVYYHQSEKGNETGHMVRVPIAGGAAEDITPDRLPYTLALLSLNFAISRAGNRIGLLPADAHGFDVLVLDVAADGALSAPRVVYHSARLLVGPVLSYDGDIAVVDTTERSGTRQFSLIALDTATGATLAEL